MIEFLFFVITVICFIWAIAFMDRPTVFMTELLFIIAGCAMYYIFVIERDTPVTAATEQALQNHATSILSAELGSYSMFLLAAIFFFIKTVPALIVAVRRQRAHGR